MKMLECLPNDIAMKISSLKDVREIRIRNAKPIRINVGGNWYYLGCDVLSLVSKSDRAYVVGENVCDEIVTAACNKSVYAHEKTLAKGFFTLDDGVRVGVCGNVFGKEHHIFQQYTSLCFRIPHMINWVDGKMLDSIRAGSTVIIGPPGSGKTTLLRDFAIKLSLDNNVLVVDERGELYYNSDIMQMGNADVLKWTEKSYAFEVGVRALSPDYIVCDEINIDDAKYLLQCMNSGVKVFCSAHGKSYDDFLCRFELLNKQFKKAIVLSETFKMTTLDCILTHNALN